MARPPTTEFAKLLSARHLCAEKDAQSNEERYIAELYYLIGANSNPHPQSLFAQTLFALEQETHPRDYAKLAHAYGDKNEARLLGTAQYLTTIWLGRLLFAKLVETRLINYHSNDTDRYRFLFLIQNDFYIKENIDGVNNKIVESWQNLDEIFEKVLHTPPAKREKSWQNKYAAIPFLQCSLFEKTPIETQTIGIAALTTEKKIPLYANTLLDTATAPDELPLLDYFLHLLNIADFGTKTIVGSLHTNGQLQLSPAVLTGVWEYWAAATGGTALNKTAAQNLYALLQNKSLPPTLSDRFFMPIAGSPQATAIALIHAAENQLLLPASAHEIPPITLFWQQDGLQVILSDGSLHEYEIKFERKLRRLPILAQPIQEAMMQAFTNAINQNISYANELPHLNWMSQWSLYAVLLQFMYYRQGNNTQLAPFAPIQLSQNEGALLLDRTLSESELLQNARLQARLQKLRTVYYTQFDAPQCAYPGESAGIQYICAFCFLFKKDK